MRSVIRSVGRVCLAAFFFALVFLAVDTLLVPRLFVAGRPAAYSRSDYWSETFVDESSLVADLRSVRQTSVGAVSTSADFDGRYINVVGGLRRTWPVPVNSSRRIVAFGGSATFCGEVPDELTWPSQLAGRVLDKEVEVVNAGLSGATFADRVKAFEGLGLAKSGDIAIFYVGVNDAVIGTQVSQVVGPLARWPRLRRVIEVMLSWSNSGRIALERSQQLSFDITASSRFAVDVFSQSLSRVEEFASAHEVRLLVVLQPSQLTLTRPTWGISNEMVEEQYRESFRDFYSQLLTSPEFGGRIVDGTQIFGSLDESPYLDYMHVQEVGNEAIASFLQAELESRGWLD